MVWPIFSARQAKHGSLFATEKNGFAALFCPIINLTGCQGLSVIIFFHSVPAFSFHLFTLLYQLCAADIIAFDDLDMISHGPFLSYCPSNRALTRSLTVTNDDPHIIVLYIFLCSKCTPLGGGLYCSCGLNSGGLLFPCVAPFVL